MGNTEDMASRVLSRRQGPTRIYPCRGPRVQSVATGVTTARTSVRCRSRRDAKGTVCGDASRRLAPERDAPAGQDVSEKYGGGSAGLCPRV